MKTSLVNTGYIELSGKTIISDPCYDRSIWCMATDVTVKPGLYATYIFMKDEKEWGVRVAAIMVVHTDYSGSIKNDWKSYECSIGVDSGQCGIFDDTVYPINKESIGKYNDKDSFYGECCKLTLGDEQGGILKSRNGIVSSSGYGDGSYELRCQYHKGECIALMVDFALEKNSAIMRALLDSQHNR